ncbi:MAG: trypsin-like peptidase domain-containing protein [Verrucomicrobiota bacterium]
MTLNPPAIRIFTLTVGCLALLCGRAFAQGDPASEPSVVAVGKVLPAVVNINTERIVRHTIQDPRDQLFNQFFGGPMRPPRELRQKVQSLGSGFLVDPAGYIVTNEHVVARAADLKIQVTLSDGKTYSARYITGDPQADLAFIKIESKSPLPFINLGDLSPNFLGQTALVLGNPMGYGISVSRGILSATNRTITMEETEYKNLIQTDAAINPGNSGGPIIDLSGKLVGVSSAKMAFTSQGVPTQGLGFGIPAGTVRDKVADFMRVARGEKPTPSPATRSSQAKTLFGLQLQDLTRDLTEVLGYEPGRGVLIADVIAGSPAAEAGLKRGLVIYKVGRFEVNSCKEVDALLSKAVPGTSADFAVGIIRQSGRRVIEQVQTIELTARESE